MIFLAAVGVIVVFIIVSYNRLVSLTQRSQSAWSDVAAQTPESRAQAEGQLGQALRGLFALAESYPDLKASANFQSLQASLGEIEDAIQNARRYFNAVVRDLNTSIQTFPSNLVAGVFQFRPHAYFELDRPDERQVPQVSFGS